MRWSEWSDPSVKCGLGVQTRSTLCGASRKRLPGKPDSTAAIYWPTCVSNLENSGAAQETHPGLTLRQCYDNCETSILCNFWMYNFDDEICTFHAIEKFDSYVEKPHVASGPKFCSGDEQAPFCGQYGKTYPGAPVVQAAAASNNVSECVETCASNVDCLYWEFATAWPAGSHTCALYGDIGAIVAVDVNQNVTKSFFGPKSCVVLDKKPASPEDAEELGYKETCQLNQLTVETRPKDTWDKEYCEDPCKNNGPCPKDSQCFDKRNETGPFYVCICQMGKVRLIDFHKKCKRLAAGVPSCKTFKMYRNCKKLAKI